MAKNFTNAAQGLISKPIEEESFKPEIPQTKGDNPKDIPHSGFKPNPKTIETKSKRVALLMQPSLFEKIKAYANRTNESINETIHSILDSEFNNQDAQFTPKEPEQDQDYLETKSKRYQMLMQPSLHKEIKANSKRYKKSVNELINNILLIKFKGEQWR